jgi:lipopolysaccharide export LptBFGC system permease protein LptF
MRLHLEMLRFFFPRTLYRKQYALRWIALFALGCLALFLFVGALINGTVYLIWIYSLLAYWIFGLAMPRLRSAGKPPALALLCAVPVINIAMLVYLFAAREDQQGAVVSAA